VSLDAVCRAIAGEMPVAADANVAAAREAAESVRVSAAPGSEAVALAPRAPLAVREEVRRD